MSVSAELLVKTFPDLLQHLDGSPSAQALGPCSQTDPKPQCIAYISDASYVSPLLASPISILVVHQKLATKAKEENAKKKTLLVSPNPYLCIARVNTHFFSLPFLKAPFDHGDKLHSTSVIAGSAQIGENAILGPGVVIGENVKVGRNTFIGAHSVIEANTTIGENCFIHPHVYIGHTCQIGNRVEIKPHSVVGSDGYGYAHDQQNNHYRIPHYGAVILEDDVHVGANVNIDRGTFEPAIIGAGTKIDNHCHFGHNVKVGRNCLITAGFITAGSATIGHNCVFGGRCSVNGHITICDGCTFGPLSGITNDVKVPGVYAGYPVIEFRNFLKAHASIEHLPRLRKSVAKIMKHLGLTEE